MCATLSHFNGHNKIGSIVSFVYAFYANVWRHLVHTDGCITLVTISLEYPDSVRWQHLFFIP